MADELENALRALGTRLDVPEAPDPTGAVLARLDEPAPESGPRAGWRPVHRLVAAAVALLVALGAAMAVSPAVRAAVYDLLRIGGVEIHENEPAPVVPRDPSVDPPLLGERDVTLDQAREAAGFPLRTPDGLGEPATVRLIDGARVVSMAYRTAHGEVRIDQFDGGLAPMFAKFTTAVDVSHVAVEDTHGVWVARPHPVLYVDRDGVVRDESARLADSTLIWEKDGITYRVEGDLTEDRAITIAESLHR